MWSEYNAFMYVKGKGETVKIRSFTIIQQYIIGHMTDNDRAKENGNGPHNIEYNQWIQ